MKSLLVCLLLIAFAQGAQAVNLSEGQSKKLYNVLAGYGLRTPNPATMQTLEWAKPAICLKEVNGGVHYSCQVHDEFHNVNVVRTGSLAKKLYHYLWSVNGAICEGARCLTRSPEVRCIHWWPNKDNPPRIRYLCDIVAIPTN